MKPFRYPSTHKIPFNQNPAYSKRLPSLLSALMACLAILTLSATLARAQTATNWLVNGDFEAGTANWVNMPPWTWAGATFATQSTNDFVNGSTTKHVTVHGGANAFKIWGYFQSYATTVGAMQTFRAAPGSTWAASGWAATEAPDNMTAAETSYIEVQFLDANTNVIGPLGDCLSATMTTNSPVDTWSQFQVVDPLSFSTNLVAPGGTAFVRFLIRFSQPAGYPGGSCYWDDVELISTSKPDPEITAQPAPQTVVYGQTAVFSVAADGQTALSYAWQNNGSDITDPNAHGVNTATLTLSNVTTSVAGYYTCTVTDEAGSLTSDGALLMVLDPGVVSITPPLGQTRTNGASATMTVAAAGSSPLSYQWQFNGNPLSDGGRIAGASSSALTVANLSAADAGTYTVMIDGGAAQAATGLKVVPASQLATNLLINPGFEDGVFAEPWEAAWAPFNGAEIDSASDFYYGSTTPVSIYDGNYVCRTYASNPDNGLYENNLPAAPGATYHVGGQFYVSSLDPVTGLSWVVLQLMFKNAGGNTIATFATPQIGTNFTTDAWTFLQVTNGTGGPDLVAPAGTASATCQVYQYAQQGGGGSVYFDDLYVTRTALAPPAAVAITPSVSGGSLHLTFPTISGVTYEVLSASGLTSPITWQTNSAVSGDGTIKTVPIPVNGAQQYYRLLEHY